MAKKFRFRSWMSQVMIFNTYFNVYFAPYVLLHMYLLTSGLTVNNVVIKAYKQPLCYIDTYALGLRNFNCLNTVLK